MKITALLVLKCNPEGSDPTILANASDVTRFGYFQRPSVREFIVFVGRTVGKRTPPGQRQSVQHEEYKVHSYNRNGLCTVGFMDDHYPVRSAFSLLNKVTCYFQGYSLGGVGAEGFVLLCCCYFVFKCKSKPMALHVKELELFFFCN
ncbi:VAMP-like protein YKT61 isoform X2 [Camellia sinensis]|uniref:VAMP-like protein YKT61 isoform X2 n=1 Tax=Camellia sinensis TaxID=4442 RepID=UPI0010363053|nr:VAMP-like protein YKT61 isoform X2 [Camellia sinensis]